MMSQVVSSDALSGALALVQMALDPKAVKATLDKIAEAKAELDRQIADLSERQAKFNQGKVELREEREAHAAAVKRYAGEFEELRAAQEAHQNVLKAFAQAQKKHKEDVTAADARNRERESAMIRRERALVERGKEVEALAAATAERTAALDEREAAVQAGEADLSERRAKLQAVLA